MNWRDVPDPDPTDDDEDVPCPGYVRAVLGFDPDEEDWNEVENAGVEDEARDPHGSWTAGGEIPTALRPKTKQGLYFNSEELHAAAADPAVEKELRGRLLRKDKVKFDELMESIQSAKKILLNAMERRALDTATRKKRSRRRKNRPA